GPTTTSDVAQSSDYFRGYRCPQRRDDGCGVRVCRARSARRVARTRVEGRADTLDVRNLLRFQEQDVEERVLAELATEDVAHARDQRAVVGLVRQDAERDGRLGGRLEADPREVRAPDHG